MSGNRSLVTTYIYVVKRREKVMKATAKAITMETQIDRSTTRNMVSYGQESDTQALVVTWTRSTIAPP